MNTSTPNTSKNKKWIIPTLLIATSAISFTLGATTGTILTKNSEEYKTGQKQLEIPTLAEAAKSCKLTSKASLKIPGLNSDADIYYQTSEYNHDISTEDAVCFLQTLGASPSDIRDLNGENTSIIIEGYQIRHDGNGIIRVFSTDN